MENIKKVYVQISRILREKYGCDCVDAGISIDSLDGSEDPAEYVQQFADKYGLIALPDNAIPRSFNQTEYRAIVIMAAELKLSAGDELAKQVLRRECMRLVELPQSRIDMDGCIYWARHRNRRRADIAAIKRAQTPNRHSIEE